MTDQDRKTAEDIVRAISADITWDGSLPADRFRAHVEQVAAALSAARGRWISVWERLPEKARAWLTIQKHGRQKLVRIAYLDDDVWRDIDSFLPVPVAHWRELPVPPQEGGSNG